MSIQDNAGREWREPTAGQRISHRTDSICESPSVIGLFAGIGGFELGFSEVGLVTAGLCELDDAARTVLRRWFDVPNDRVWHNIVSLGRLPKSDMLAAGFPCQDLSQAGRKAGIGGERSGLVGHLFRLMDGQQVDTVVMENVSYMLRLDKGAAVAFLVDQFEQRGYHWAYRVVDARSFGIPQRRQRVLFVASKTVDPSAVLHADVAGGEGYDDSVGEVDEDAAYGFYWTEGLRGLGWTKNAVPTIKSISSLGIPSPPAIWFPKSGVVGMPTIADTEALQGFPRGWTEPAAEGCGRKGVRWQLIGNAVCVPMSAWLGKRLRAPGVAAPRGRRLDGPPWPIAAVGGPSGSRYAVEVLPRVDDIPFRIESFLRESVKPLSAKGTRGFLNRARRSNLRFADGFLEALDRHLAAIKDGVLTA